MRFKWLIIISLLSLKWHKWRFKNTVSRLQAIRWKRLQKTLLNSPFYKELTLKGSLPQEYPIINKALFMENFDAINTRGIKKKAAFDLAIEAENSRDFSPTLNGVTVGLSSGTSGNRGIFLASERERAQWVACVLDRVIGFSLKSRKVAFFLRANSNLYDSVKSKVLEFNFYDLMIDMEVHIKHLNVSQPDILVAPASALNILTDEADKKNLKINPSKIISVAEVLYPEDRQRMEDVFGQTIHQVYQCTEGMLATTCEHGTLHFNEDFIRIERKYIDEEQKRFHPVITDLIRSSQPVIRYELNDIVTAKENCPCASPFIAIDQIEGRSDDILLFKDKKGNTKHLFPDYLRRAIILSSENFKEYQVIQKNEDSISLYASGDDVEKATKAIDKLLKSFDIENIHIEIAKTLQQEKGAKFRRIRNDYKDI